MKPKNLEKVQLENSDEVIWAHTPDKCKGQICCLHNRSEHHMRSWPQHWRNDRKIMERICPCGVGHVDFDDPTKDRIHGCCCEHSCYSNFEDRQDFEEVQKILEEDSESWEQIKAELRLEE